MPLYKRFFKRLIDFSLSFLGMLLLFPLFLILSMTLVIVNNGSPFFIHERAGLLGKKFRFYKFRTMSNQRDKNGKLLPDNDRLSKSGRFIRSVSLDELPQLFNVLIGDMSLIGPRPLLIKYLDRYTPEQAKRHNVKPGITGWAQINGRNSISWQKKFELDIYYVENYSFIFDMKIFWKTVKKVFFREGINAGNSSTMEEFKGN